MSPRLAPLLAALTIFGAPHALHAQEWRASARVGRVTGESAPAGASGSSSAVVGLARSAPRSWLGLSAAVPLSDDPFWAVLGGWDRFDTRGSAGVLLDVSGQGFIQRQSDGGLAPAPSPTSGPLTFPSPTTPTPLRPDPSGQGVNGEAMAGMFVRSALLRLEARGGVAAQSSTLGGVAQDRTLPTGDARVTYGLAPVTLQVESRAWLDDRITHGYVGAGLQYARGPVALSGSVGRWVSGGLDATAWLAAAGAQVAPGLMLQIGGRGNAFDPLYLSASRSSFWGGLSLRLGGSRAAALAPVPVRARDGRAVVELAARDASGSPSIAGDFTGWKPVPMRREGSRWTWTGPLARGVYHYAFVAADGTWFVPESVAGRQKDGMGGWTAVLVVS